VSRGVHIVFNHTAVDALPEDEDLRDKMLKFKKDAKRMVGNNCMAEGLTLGRSTAFITAVMCEMLRAYTVRSTEPALSIWNRNKWMHLACGVSFLLTVSLTFIPGVKDIFKLDNPAWFYYFISFIFAFGCAANDEFWKLIYRRVLINRLKSHKGPVELLNIREHVEMAVEMLHEVEKKVDKCQNSLTENRHTIGRVKVEVDSLTHNTPLKREAAL